MLYEAAIKFLKLAIRDFEAKDYKKGGTLIGKANDIINELNTVLDMDDGGEIASNLRKLYSFMNERLTQANTRKDTEMIREVITLLEELNQGWKAIAD